MSAVLESYSGVSWEWKPLGESCLVIAGQSPPGKYYNSNGDGSPFYQGKKEFTARFVGPPTKWTTHVTKEAEVGDVLMSVRAPVGPVNFCTELICIGRGLAAIRAGESLNKDFLFYGLLSKQSEISGNEGAVFASINKKQIEAIRFPVPPLPEQERIVAILDEAFEGIATATAQAERNLQNARELFQSVLQSTFEQKGEDWVESVIGEICEVKDGTHDSPKYVEEGIPFVTQKNVTWDGLSFEKTRRISQEDHDKFYKRSNVAFGDVLISMIGANRGMACLVDDKRTFSIKNVGLFKASSELDSAFLLMYLRSPIAADHVSSLSKGAAQGFIGLGALREFPISLPPLDQQKAVVQKLDALAAETRRLEAIYQRKLDALVELKQSLLQRAFAGEL